MERRDPVMRMAALVCASLLFSTAQAPAAERTMVLIVSAASPVQHLDIIDVRKLFLGLTVMGNDRPLRAIDNRSDDKLHQAFLQNVIAMPERSYEMRLLSITLQQGARRPEVFQATPDLLNAVAADPRAVSVAWATDVAKDHRIKVLRVLWRD